MGATAYFGPKVQQFFLDHPDWLPAIDSACPDGWDDILAQALLELKDLAGKRGRRISIAQIKQKWAQLRVYIKVEGEPRELYWDVVSSNTVTSARTAGATGDSITTEAIAIIDRAMEQAARTCEECGAPGKVRQAGWIRVLCDQHAKPRHRGN